MRFSRTGLSAKGRDWAGAIEDQARSGMTIREFCRTHDLSEPSFYDWRRRLRERQADVEAERAAARRNGPDGDVTRRNVESGAAKVGGASAEDSAETGRSCELFVPVAVTIGDLPTDDQPPTDVGFNLDATASNSPACIQVTSPAGWKIAVPEFADAGAVRSLLGIVNELPAMNGSASNDSATRVASERSASSAEFNAEAHRC